MFRDHRRRLARMQGSAARGRLDRPARPSQAPTSSVADAWAPPLIGQRVVAAGCGSTSGAILFDDRGGSPAWRGSPVRVPADAVRAARPVPADAAPGETDRRDGHPLHRRERHPLHRRDRHPLHRRTCGTPCRRRRGGLHRRDGEPPHLRPARDIAAVERHLAPPPGATSSPPGRAARLTPGRARVRAPVRRAWAPPRHLRAGCGRRVAAGRRRQRTCRPRPGSGCRTWHG